MIKSCENCANKFDCFQRSGCNIFNKTGILLDLWKPTIDLFDELLEENKKLDQARCNEIREKAELGLTYRNQIRVLEARVQRLEREKEELVITLDNELKEQEKRINKMKCCWNCKHIDTEDDSCRIGGISVCDGINKWELKE